MASRAGMIGRWGRTMVAVVALVGAVHGVRAQDEALPESVEVRLELDSVEARPGDVARLTLSITTTEPVDSVGIALNFDETNLKLLGVERLGIAGDDPGGGGLVGVGPNPLEGAAFNNFDDNAGNQADEGWVYLEIGSVQDFAGIDIPLGEMTTLLGIDFLVLDNAIPGFSPVVFAAVGPADDFDARAFENEVLLGGAAPDAGPPPLADLQFVGGGIKIIGEIGFFMRGDSNFDRRRDIADPVYTLRYLFTGGHALLCEDAGDANDDGNLDVSDVVYTLRHLYITPGPFPAPTYWGRDPTRGDSLNCKFYDPSP